MCLSQAHTFLKTDFLAELDKAARNEGYGVVVFNSSMDYYWSQNGNNITGCIYELIRYDRLAALVILAGDLYDTQMQEEIIHKAGLQKIPVFWQGGVHNGCISISTDYEKATKPSSAMWSGTTEQRTPSSWPGSGMRQTPGCACVSGRK